MPKPTPVVREEKKGEYTIRHCEDGTYRISGPRLRKYGFFLPSETQTVNRYHRELKTDKRLSDTTKTHLQMYGIIASGSPQTTEGRTYLGLPPGRTIISLDTIHQTVKNYWSAKEIEDARKKRQSTPRLVKDFQKEHPAEYHECFQRHRGFRKVLEGMEPPYDTSYLFLTRRKRRETINPTRLGEQLYKWACEGKPIAPSYLRGCPRGSAERLAWNSLKTLAENDMLPVSSVLRVESRLTGLSEKDIRTTIVDRKRNSVLAENLVMLLFQWAPIVGVDTSIPGVPTRARKQVEFYYSNEPIDEASFDKGKIGHADLRIQDDTPIGLDFPIEVKSYVGEFPRKACNGLLERYASENRMWVTGEPMARCLTIFHQPELTYRQYKQKIEQAGIEIMPFSQFYTLLEQTVGKIKQNPALVANLPPTSPRANLEYLLQLSREVAGYYLLLRTTNSHRRGWSLDMLHALNQRAVKIRTGEYDPSEHSRDPKLKIPGAKTIRHKGVKYLSVQRKFDEINSGSVGQYIRDHHSNLTLTSLQHRLHKLEGIAKHSLLFFDLETCGLAYTDPIISIGYSRFNDGRVLESRVLLARDYSEEKPMIDHFLGIVADHDRILTYNGTSFDLPRLSERAKQNGIRLIDGKRFTPLQESLGKKHIDLYPLVKKKYPDLPDKKLGTLESLLFDPPFERQLNIPSEQIPQVYMDYVHPERRRKWIDVTIKDDEGKETKQRQWEFTETVKEFKQRVALTRQQNGKRLTQIVEHNLMDTITLIATLAKLCESA